jgi:hypothetical protein
MKREIYAYVFAIIVGPRTASATRSLKSSLPCHPAELTSYDIMGVHICEYEMLWLHLK